MSHRSRSSVAVASSRKRRSRHDDSNSDQEEEEEEYQQHTRRHSQVEEEEEQPRRRRNERGARNAPPAAAVNQPVAPPLPPTRMLTAAHQALLRYMNVNGRATFEEIQQFFDQTKQHCSGADSRTLPLLTAWDDLNQSIRFMGLEIRRMKSEIDDLEHWILVDNTDRVAAANASFNDNIDNEDGNVHAAASSSARASVGGNKMDAASMAKFLNPSQFNEKQVLYFKALIDSILAAPNGQISRSDARSSAMRTKATADRKNQLSNEDEVAICLQSLLSHGWIRENPNELTGAASNHSNRQRRSSASVIQREPMLCLGERTYAELRNYIDETIKGRKCAICQQPCLFSLTCLNQSSSSRRVADSDADPSSTCQAKIHYHCAREAFLRRGREDCPTCGQRWDKYLMKKEGGENGADGEDEQPGAISSYRPEAASSPPVAAAAAATSSSRRSRQSNR